MSGTLNLTCKVDSHAFFWRELLIRGWKKSNSKVQKTTAKDILHMVYECMLCSHLGAVWLTCENWCLREQCWIQEHSVLQARWSCSLGQPTLHLRHDFLLPRLEGYFAFPTPKTKSDSHLAFQSNPLPRHHMCPTSGTWLVTHPTWNAFSPEMFLRARLNVSSTKNL